MTGEDKKSIEPVQWQLASNLCVGIVVASCLSGLVMSIYPGLLREYVFPAVMVGVVVIPFLLIGLIALSFNLYRKQKLSIKHLPWKHCVAAAFVVVMTGMAIRLQIPRRMAFSSCRNSFERLTDHDVQSDRNFDRSIGPYHIDQCLLDDRGGIYFRTYTGADGIGPDTMSYGFCYNPNPIGSPFGGASYRTASLGNGWYCFRASDDWF